MTSLTSETFKGTRPLKGQGYGSPDGRCLPCSGVSGRAVGISPKMVSDVKFLSLRCVSRHKSSVCNATSSNYRRNQDYSRQNKHSYSRNRNRHNEDRVDGYEDLEEAENFSNKNETLLSVSEYRKFQATASPGPREKEIVELFRKVQAQLRERATMKEERKVEDSHEKNRESETVDSLLKLLRKHSVQPGRKSTTIASNKEFILDQPEKVSPGPSTEVRETSFSDSNSNVKNDIQEIPSPHLSRPKSNFRKNTNIASNKDLILDEPEQVGPGPSTVKSDIQESPSPHLTRPKSSFRKRSPVPEVKFQPVYSVSTDMDGVRKSDEINEVMIESDVGPAFSEGNVLDKMPGGESNEIDESEHDNGAKEEEDVVESADLSGMKLTELRALAKSRGMKGFSKLKKSELVELLRGSSI
ncbi:hypothetical protein BUALT_Bualt13G0022500 [Buddleja alternifolia]|uniref:Rho termination factor-like N-terminal domain-containing protein n=1 Tax=Buddleja alternifolia TaxID=168488 RepID=A0AAV6WJR7_9LAMI|nr:hypothetical protein BUALT_Bualt13G0022500 [Buddleja alternifolia]